MTIASSSKCLFKCLSKFGFTWLILPGNIRPWAVSTGVITGSLYTVLMRILLASMVSAIFKIGLWVLFCRIWSAGRPEFVQWVVHVGRISGISTIFGRFVDVRDGLLLLGDWVSVAASHWHCWAEGRSRVVQEELLISGDIELIYGSEPQILIVWFFARRLRCRHRNLFEFGFKPQICHF